MQSEAQNKERIQRLFRAYSESDDVSVHLIRAVILKRSQPRLPTNEANELVKDVKSTVHLDIEVCEGRGRQREQVSRSPSSISPYCSFWGNQSFQELSLRPTQKAPSKAADRRTAYPGGGGAGSCDQEPCTVKMLLSLSKLVKVHASLSAVVPVCQVLCH